LKTRFQLAPKTANNHHLRNKFTEAAAKFYFSSRLTSGYYIKFIIVVTVIRDKLRKKGVKVLDVTLRSIHAGSYRKQTFQGAGWMLAQAEKSKQVKYADIIKNINIREGRESHVLIPFAIETLGSWGKEAQKFVQSCFHG